MPKKPKPKDLSRYTVHMIGNAHIDPVWQWRWEEGRQEVLDTCRAAVERIKDTPGFIFCRSSAATYAWIEETDPELFAEIKRWVARGRWCVVNGWWVQPDCNVPCGEALVRQGLYGQRYFLEKFGVAARTGYNVDTFGHATTLPQILTKQGMDQYCFFRPDPNEKELPSNLFWWEGPDGSRVLAARMPGHYGAWGDEIEQRIYEAAEQTAKGLRDTMSFYGVGNHGGGPTLANIESIRKVDADPKGPQAIFSSPDQFFDVIRDKAAKLPVVAEELQYHSRGCYTAVSALKQHNRRSENLLLQAEKLSCLAGHLTGLEYPAADLECAWKRVLFNQFHDILAGTSIRPACDDAICEYEEAETLAARAIRNATTRISSRINTSGEGRPIVVYNTLSWKRKDVVEVEVSWPNHDDAVRLVDECGKPVPFQVTHTNISGRGTTISLVFLAEVPACGYRTYRLLQGALGGAARGDVVGGAARGHAVRGRGRPTAPARPTSGDDATISLGRPLLDLTNPFLAGPTFIESNLYRLEFDPEAGYITRLLDKRSGNDLLAGPANVPIVIDDPSDTWSHGVDSFRDDIGRFEADLGIEVVEVGPVRARVLVEMTYGDSTLIQDIRLYRDVPRIDVRLTVDYHGRHEFLKIAFPTTVGPTVLSGATVAPTPLPALNNTEGSGPVATFEVPYGHVTRPATGNEEPAQKWADVSGALEDGTELGLAVLNDAKYGYDICGGELRLSALRTPIYCFHEPAQGDPRRRYEFVDQGIQSFTYSLLPHTGDWREGDVVRQAQQLNHPCLAREEPAHAGVLESAISFAGVEAQNVIIEAIKRHEDGEGYILRAYETHGEATATNLTFARGKPIALDFAPYEIKTLLVTDGKAREVDMLER